MIISDQPTHKIDYQAFSDPANPNIPWRDTIQITVFHIKGDEWQTKVIRMNKETAIRLAQEIVTTFAEDI